LPLTASKQASVSQRLHWPSRGRFFRRLRSEA
jgi:hypothetical protein